MKLIHLLVLIMLSMSAKAGICKNENLFSPYEAKGIENGLLLYGFSKESSDYRFVVRMSESVKFSTDRLALIDGDIYQFVEQEISSLKLKKGISEKEVLQEIKKMIISEVRSEGVSVKEQCICDVPNNPNKREFLSWKLDISASASKPAMTQFYSATILNNKIVLINAATEFVTNTKNIEQSMAWFMATFQEVSNKKDCPKL